MATRTNEELHVQEGVFRIAPLQVHPEMEGFVAVLPAPYFALTGTDGSYQIKDVPHGSYNVKVWHPKLKAAQKNVNVKGATEASFEIAK